MSVCMVLSTDTVTDCFLVPETLRQVEFRNLLLPTVKFDNAQYSVTCHPSTLLLNQHNFTQSHDVTHTTLFPHNHHSADRT